MKYELRRPCPHCPFRTDIRPFLRKARAREIAKGLERGEFACHETTVDAQDEDEDSSGQRLVTSGSQHCAGALIMLEKMERPSQMMRICERLRAADGRPYYDRELLDMSSPVYESSSAFIRAHR